MTPSPHLARLQPIFRETLDEPQLVLDPSLRLGEVDSWDSFNHINLVIAIETEYGIEFDIDEIVEFVSVSSIVEALERRDPESTAG